MLVLQLETESPGFRGKSDVVASGFLQKGQVFDEKEIRRTG